MGLKQLFNIATTNKPFKKLENIYNEFHLHDSPLDLLLEFWFVFIYIDANNSGLKVPGHY